MAPPAGPLAIVDPAALAALKALAVTIPNQAGDGLVVLLYVDGEGRIGVGPGPSQSAAAPDASAALDLQSTRRGFLMPRLTATERNAIPSPAVSLLLYNTTSAQYEWWNGGAWVPLGGGGGGTPWLVTGNTLGAPGVFGSLDAEPVHVVTNGTRRMTVLATGEVAIGASDPSVGFLLEVQGSGTQGVSIYAGSHGVILGDPNGYELFIDPNTFATYLGYGALRYRAGVTPSIGQVAPANDDGPDFTISASDGDGAGHHGGSIVLRAGDVTGGATPGGEARIETSSTRRVSVAPFGGVSIGPVAATPGNLLEVRGDLTGENVEVLGQNTDIFAANTVTVSGGLAASVHSNGPVDVISNDNLFVGGGTITLDANTQIIVASSGQLALRAVPVHADDSTTGQPIGNLDAAHSVDITTWIEANQTTAGQTPILPDPNNNDKCCDVTVINVGVTPLTLYGKAIAPSQKCTYTWSPGLAAWVPPV